MPPFALLLVLACVSARANGEVIVAARYAGPVERYGHFALGRPHEYARLLAATDARRELALELPENEVFEDLAPRLVRLGPDQPLELLVIVSRRDSGSRMALVALAAGRLAIAAQSPAIGTPNRWLNPVGVADLDGDGHAEIAAVITPHIGGTLKVYRRKESDLVEVAALAGFSNHTYGTSELRLSMPLASGGRVQLVVPDSTRRFLRIVALEGNRLRETRRCELPAPLNGPLEATVARAC